MRIRKKQIRFHKNPMNNHKRKDNHKENAEFADNKDTIEEHAQTKQKQTKNLKNKKTKR